MKFNMQTSWEKTQTRDPKPNHLWKIVRGMRKIREISHNQVKSVVSCVQKVGSKMCTKAIKWKQFVKAKHKEHIAKLNQAKIGTKPLKIKQNCFKVLKTHRSQNQSLRVLELQGKSENEIQNAN